MAYVCPGCGPLGPFEAFMHAPMHAQERNAIGQDTDQGSQVAIGCWEECFTKPPRRIS